MLPAIQRSLDELGTPLIDTTFCVIDLETTGTDREADRITEIGAVRYRAGECLGTFQTLINPGRAIPPKITVLTGLTDSLVATAPRIESILASLLEFIGDGVIVGHNVAFDLGFLNAALVRSGRDRLDRPVVDTVALARRLVRSEVSNCRLGTLAEHFGLPHQPAHRALDDARATADLLHLLLERAAGHGVLGIDDLVSYLRIGRHPQSSKLHLTTDLPRRPGVYLFRDHRDEVLYVGKATNLRQRVRSYFGSDDRRKIGPMLREMATISHLELPDPLTAEIVERRIIARDRPRYNRVGTRSDRACFVRLDTAATWPRLSVGSGPLVNGVNLGPLPSRSQATFIVEAIESVVPLRRCSRRIGPRYQADSQSSPCSYQQLGVAACPCSGAAEPESYRAAVTIAELALRGDIAAIVDPAMHRLRSLAAQQRYEEAADMRDRLEALVRAADRRTLVDRLSAAGDVRLRHGPVVWAIRGTRLIDVRVDGDATTVLPLEPPPIAAGAHLSPQQFAEALCLARYLHEHSAEIEVLECSGIWGFPAATVGDLGRL